jgi:hypothetical protein
MYVHRRSIDDCATGDKVASNRQLLEIDFHGPVVGRNPEMLPVFQQDHRVIRITEAYGRPHDRIEHWLYVGRRATDDTQDFACSRLLLE